MTTMAERAKKIFSQSDGVIPQKSSTHSDPGGWCAGHSHRVGGGEGVGRSGQKGRLDFEKLFVFLRFYSSRNYSTKSISLNRFWGVSFVIDSHIANGITYFIHVTLL